MENKQSDSAMQNGLIEQAGFDASVPQRPQTNEEAQRPMLPESKVKADRGSFTMK